MSIHKVPVCETVEQHIARDIAAGTVRWTLTDVMADFAAEQELVGPDPFETPRSYADVMGPGGTRYRFRAIGESESMDRALAGGR